MRFTATPLVVLALAAACSKSGDSTSTSSTSGTSSTASPKPSSDDRSPSVHLPAPGTFQVDPTHSTVLFKVHHAGAGYVYGWFKDFSGTFTIDTDPKKSHIELAVKAASVDTRDDERNTNIAGPDFLNAKQSPELTFKSTSVDAASPGWRVTGDLTIDDLRRVNSSHARRRRKSEVGSLPVAREQRVIPAIAGVPLA